MPLNAICSSMWEMPIRARVSLRAPQSTQTPTAALSSCGIGSVTTVKPLESLVISMFMQSIGRSLLDEGPHLGRIIGQDGHPLHPLIEAREPRAARGARCRWPGARHPGTWPDGRSRARPPGRCSGLDSWRRGQRHGGVRIDQPAGLAMDARDGRKRLAHRRPRRRRSARAGATARLAASASFGSRRSRPSPSRSHSAVAARGLEQRALEIAGDLDVHGRAERRTAHRRAHRRPRSGRAP